MKEKCCATVMPPGQWHSHRCERNASVEHGGKPYCRQHNPAAKAARDAERQAKWDAEERQNRSDRDKAKAQRRLLESAVEAIRQIAAGHNDPRALAQSVLDANPD